MAIDARIPMMGGGGNTSNMLMALLMDRNRRGERQQRQAGQDSALRALMGGTFQNPDVTPATGPLPEGASRFLAPGERVQGRESRAYALQQSPQTVLAYDQAMTGQRTAQRQAEEAQREATMKRAEVAYKLLRGVQASENAPAVYPAARQQYLEMYPDAAANVPETYDPKWVGTQLSAGQRLFDPDILSPAAEEQKMRIRAAGAPKTIINTSGTVAEAEAKEYGKSLVKQFDAVSDRADAAEDEIAQLETARRISVETGAFEPLKAGIAALSQGLGIDPETFGLTDASPAQAYRGVLNNLVLTKMQAQKGPQTENDAKRIQQTVASLSNTNEANDFLIRSALALNRRRVEQRDFYETYRSEGGSFKGARQAWGRYKAKTPLVGTNPSTRLPVFYSEFRDTMRGANPDMTDARILSIWREKYQ